MGTRADFYIVAGGHWNPDKAVYLGSVHCDGWPSEKGDDSGVPLSLLRARTTTVYRREVTKLLRARRKRGGATFGSEGWPWHWETSKVTDQVYAFFKGRVWRTSITPRVLLNQLSFKHKDFDSHFWNDGWYNPLKNSEQPVLAGEVIFPNMQNRLPAAPAKPQFTVGNIAVY